jgi:transcriptional regulator with XRE-family HTH domain
VRAARRARGLSQAQLAARSRTSRVTLARLESGAPQDVRAGTLSRLLDALGLELVAAPSGALQTLEARLLRAEGRVRTLELRRRHAALAARLLASPAPRAAALLRRARARVALWERERLCSTHYISRWRGLLAGPVPRVARSLIAPGEWGDALFQNSPWSFAFDPPAE